MWFFSTALIIAVTVPSAFAEDDAHPAKAHLSKALIDTLKANPCHLLEEIFRTTDDPRGTCSKLRKPNGDLLLRLTLKDGDDLVELTEVGQKCRGRIVAADVRPKKVPRWVSYVAITLEAADEQTLRFGGGLTSKKEATDGNLETIGGCGPAVMGQVRFVHDKWHLLHRQAEGCRE